MLYLSRNFFGNSAQFYRQFQRMQKEKINFVEKLCCFLPIFAETMHTKNLQTFKWEEFH